MHFLPLLFEKLFFASNVYKYFNRWSIQYSIVECIFKFQGWIWENARPIIEERQELERVQAEAERNRASNQNDDYTSLYWDPEAAGGRAGAKSENEYEVNIRL